MEAPREGSSNERPGSGDDEAPVLQARHWCTFSGRGWIAHMLDSAGYTACHNHSVPLFCH